MQDWRDGQLRYLVHFDDGGSGMRLRPEPLNVGIEVSERGDCHRVTRVATRARADVRARMG